MDSSDPDTLVFRGNSVVNADCGIMSDSYDPAQALVTSGGQVVNATWIGVSGGYLNEGSSGSTSPQPVEDVPPMMDPLSYLEPPDYSGWPTAVYSAATRTYSCPTGQCFWPGTLQISGPAGVVTIEPGIYALQNGMNVESQLTVRGEEVMFYNAAEGGHGIRIAGGATAELSAPTSGYYKGILFYGNPEVCDLYAQENDIGRGESTFRFKGTLYFPCQNLSWAGTTFGVNPWGMIIGNKIDFAGNQNLFLPRPPLGEAPLITKPTLIE